MKRSTIDTQTSEEVLKEAFSLIEVLVVLAVLAILLVLLFPAVMQVKDRAESAKCMANLRRLGTGLNLYVAENNFYPGAAPSPGVFWIQYADHYSPSEPLVGLRSLSASTRCPSRAPDTGEFGLGYGYNYAGFGFSPNSTGAADLPMEERPPKYWQVRPARIENPSKVILLGDGLDEPPPGTYGEMFLYLNYFAGAPVRHNGGGNYLFVDGHTEWLNPESLEKLFVVGKQTPLYPF